MAKGRKPAKVKGVYFRTDRQVWAAGYKVDGKWVRKSHPDRAFVITWLETAQGIKHKEGIDSLPTSARDPLLTRAEKQERVAEYALANAITVGRLNARFVLLLVMTEPTPSQVTRSFTTRFHAI